MVPAFAAKTAATAGGADYAPKDAAVDAEVIEMVMTFFARLKLDGVQLEINSIGHAAENCRRGYVQKLKAALEAVKERLGPDSQRRIETNPLRVLDSKLESEQAIIAELPKIGDSLCDECKAQYAEVKRQLDLRGVAYKENWRLVRGLDYYMRTTFEITAKGLGSQNAVCGGGRYDGLVELLGGLPTKGIGFAIGEDRLIFRCWKRRRASPPPVELRRARLGLMCTLRGWGRVRRRRRSGRRRGCGRRGIAWSCRRWSRSLGRRWGRRISWARGMR